MTLSFPNPSRSYDAPRHRIRFWGHDSALEIPFFIKEDALFRLNPKAGNTESAILSTFDAMRQRINAVAEKIYSFDRRSFYVLVAADF